MIAPAEPSPNPAPQSSDPETDAPPSDESATIPPPEAVPRAASRVCRPVIARYDATAYDPSPAALASLLAALVGLDLGMPGEPGPLDLLCPCGCGGRITAAGAAMLA